MKTCSSCGFYEPTPEMKSEGADELGYCHLNPPAILYNQNTEQVIHCMPGTYSEWYCAFYNDREGRKKPKVLNS